MLAVAGISYMHLELIIWEWFLVLLTLVSVLSSAELSSVVYFI